MARQFFKSGAAAGTIAKTMSAYDMKFSDAIYGVQEDGRYVSRARVLAMLEKEFVTAIREDRRDELAAFRGPTACPACGGSRLRPEANSVRVGGKTIHEICCMPVAEARRFFTGLEFSCHLPKQYEFHVFTLLGPMGLYFDST